MNAGDTGLALLSVSGCRPARNIDHGLVDGGADSGPEADDDDGRRPSRHRGSWEEPGLPGLRFALEFRTFSYSVGAGDREGRSRMGGEATTKVRGQTLAVDLFGIWISNNWPTVRCGLQRLRVGAKVVKRDFPP
jgi:hypothetical protein